MFSLLLEIRLLEFLQTPNKLVGMILAALGLAFALLAKKITKVARKTDKPSKSDPIYVIILAISLCVVLVGLIITIF